MEAVGRGDGLLDTALTQRVMQEVRRAGNEKDAVAFTQLSKQERNVLLLVTGGKTNKQIAKTLFLGEGTVRNYASSIFLKVGS